MTSGRKRAFPLLRILPFVVALGGLAMVGCSSTPLLRSELYRNNTTIDGNDSDWTDATFYLPDDQVSIGVRNDSADLFLMFKATTPQQVFQILGNGFTVWFDPSGGSDKDFGIQFPLSRAERNAAGMPFGSDENETPVQRMQREMEIFTRGEKEPPLRLNTMEAKGIQIYVKRYENSLVYELEVPLHSTADLPYALNTKGSRIGIGFETGKFERPARTGGDRGEGFSGGRSGFGGRGGMRRDGGREGGAPREAPKPIDLWVDVDLAK